MTQFKHELGDEAVDLVTGFKGIITARSEHLNGCIRYGVQSSKLTNENKPLEAEWFDEKQLKIVNKKKVNVESKRTGGPAQTPRMFSNPK